MAIKQNKKISAQEELLVTTGVKYKLPKVKREVEVNKRVSQESGSLETGLKRDLVFALVAAVIFILAIVIISRFMLG